MRLLQLAIEEGPSAATFSAQHFGVESFHPSIPVGSDRLYSSSANRNMGIKFTCPACGRALNVKSELGGKKGRCPKCQAKIEIPAESAADSGSSGSQASSPSGLAPAPATGLPSAGAVTSAEKSTILLTPQAAGVPGGVADPISEA